MGNTFIKFCDKGEGALRFGLGFLRPDCLGFGFFSLFGLSPDISAHARVFAQGIGVANNLKPLGVQDPGVIPCVQATFYGGSSPQTILLAVLALVVPPLAYAAAFFWQRLRRKK